MTFVKQSGRGLSLDSTLKRLKESIRLNYRALSHTPPPLYFTENDTEGLSVLGEMQMSCT